MSASAPKTPAPAGTCDTHMHIYEPGFPMAPTASIGPVPNATLPDYLKLRETLGIERTVIVQPSTYGTDNRCTLEAMAKLGDSARAVVTIDTSISDDELADLTAKGARGARFFLVGGGPVGWDILDEIAHRIADHGWHIQLQIVGREFPEREAAISNLPCGLVIDHIGRFEDPIDVDHPAFQCLRRLVAGGAYMKLSAPYYASKKGPPAYEEAGPLVRRLIEDAPERMLWATNWPHPGETPRPDDGILMDALMAPAGNQATRRRILVDNPAALYGF